MSRYCLCVVVLCMSMSSIAVGQGMSATKSGLTDKSVLAEQGAINKLIDKYNQTEDDCDFAAQAELMSADRIFVGSAGEGRATSQLRNMAAQKMHMNEVKKEVPGIQWYTDSRDRIIRFYGDGTTAVASFYWFRALYLPANTSTEIASRHPQPPVHAVTLVLEKKKGTWKIVHTHMSLLYPVAPGH